MEYNLRLRKDVSHRIITNPTAGKGRVQRLKCVLCCYKCIKGIPVEKHYREGRQTSKICATCKLQQCSRYDESYHTAEFLPIPLCVTSLNKHRMNKDVKIIKALKNMKDETPINVKKRKDY